MMASSRHPQLTASGDDMDDIERLLSTTTLLDDEKKKKQPVVVSFSEGKQLVLNTREDAESVAHRIETAPCMNTLELRGNTVGVGAGERIAEAIAKHPELENALWSDMFTGRLRDEIPPILRSLCSAMIAANVQLRELDLSDNAFGQIGAESIEHFLTSSSAFTLQTLKMNNNGLGIGGKVIAKSLLTCLHKSKAANHCLQLKVLVIGRNRLENACAIALAEAITAIGTLEQVSMPQNGICKEGIMALARAFGNNPQLKVINLSDNTFTADGAIAMSKTLPKLINLEVIDFSDCLCRNDGTRAIVNAIGAQHTCLRELNLSGNEIGSTVAKNVIDHFSNRKLFSLILQSNNFGGEFDELKCAADRAGYTVDVGNESDDQGSLSENSDDDEDEENSDDDDDK